MKKTIKSSISILITILLFSACSNLENTTKVVLTNNSEFKLTDKTISINRDSLPHIENSNKFPLITSGADTIPSQLNDTNSDGNWDELFFVTDFSPQEKRTILLKWVDVKPNYRIRTSARFGKRSSIDSPVQPAIEETLIDTEVQKALGYQRYQTDGPSWENDKVGFRHYLDGRNAKDLFGKKTTKMSPENVGINAEGAVEDNYHVMENWGRDILSVGNSVGLGGYALTTSNELMRLGITTNDSINNVEKTIFKIETEGPVKSVLSYNYQNWKPNYRTYSVEEKTTICPGIYGYKNTVTLSGLKGDENLAIGIVNINNDNPVSIIDENSKYIVLYTHDKQTYNKEWWLGMALILPKDKYIDYINAPETGNLSHTFLAQLKINNNQPINYYAIACWELSDSRFIDETYFSNYLKQITNQLSAEIKIEFKN